MYKRSLVILVVVTLLLTACAAAPSPGINRSSQAEPAVAAPAATAAQGDGFTQSDKSAVPSVSQDSAAVEQRIVLMNADLSIVVVDPGSAMQTITNAALIDDLNFVEFRVNNLGAGYTGLRVEFTGVNAPLPPDSASLVVIQPRDQVGPAGGSATFTANALGTPPVEIIKMIHDRGRKVAALCGSPRQALKHAEADVDIIIAQGGEGGGHCGEVGSMVLWPQVVKAVAPRPVLAAGGIGSGQQIAAALALGCQGAWSGSQWLMVEEAENTPVQQEAYIKATSRDTVRSRSFTGKPCRMLKNDWNEAWAAEGNPEPLGMPLQYMVSGMAVSATHKWPDRTVDVAFNPVGQVVGQFEKVEKTSAVMARWVEEYIEASGQLDAYNAAATSA